MKAPLFAAVGLILCFAVVACSAEEATPVLKIAGIPDQNSSTIARRYDVLTSYLSRELGVDVKFVPTVDYAATVIGFKQGEIHMAWFGGLTGVQARSAVSGSKVIAHRPRDAEFHSKFIVGTDLNVESLRDLEDVTFTFGSESSTSGHLMPRYFLMQSGIDPDDDFLSPPNYSGSHDKTWKLVESGAFQAGALNEAVWDSAVAKGAVDLSRVRELSSTPPYYDYNWTVRGDLDETFGEGFTARVQDSLLSIDGRQKEILELFQAEKFVVSKNENYQSIKDVAVELGILN
jgi:phosphonate transport system substrate-binding protein